MHILDRICLGWADCHPPLHWLWNALNNGNCSWGILPANAGATLGGGGGGGVDIWGFVLYITCKLIN
jgi:hypothetical protein